MRGGNDRQSVLRVMLAVATLIVVAACGAPAPEPTAVPTFYEETRQPTPSAAPGADDGVVPERCDDMLAAAELEALFGLPLHTVSVQTTIGIAAPSVGRTERVTCVYTGAGSDVLLDFDASAFVNPDAATAQWRINLRVWDGTHRELSIGDASAVLIEQPDKVALLVAYGVSNLTILLPHGPLPGDRSPDETLIDLALRVLPAVSTQVPAAATGASYASGTVS